MIYLVRYLLVTLYTIFWGLLGVLLGLLDRRGLWVLWVGRKWVRWVMASCGVKVEADGLENVPEPCIVMSNHQSVFDIAVLLDTFPNRVWRFVAKRELLRVPFFGWAMALAKQVIVDRGNNEKAVQSLKVAAERVRNGENVLIFPEGSRSSDAILHDFKSGGFHLAIESGVPIVPVTVSGSQWVTPKGSLRIESGRVLIRYGKPIATERLGIEDRNDLKEQVREAILAGYDPALQPNGGLPDTAGPA